MTTDPHDGLLALDTHVDIPWPEGASPFEDGPRCVDLPKLRRGRVAAVCFAAYIPQGRRDTPAHAAAAERARAMLTTIAAMAPADGSGGLLATSAAQVEAAYAAGKPGIIPAIENGYAIGRSLALLDEFAARGIRYMTLTHNGHNEIADAAIPLVNLGDKETEYGGLSDFGQAVVDRMNELGVLVDISHAAKPTMMQAAARSRIPVVATHSCMRALCDHKRNLDDEQLDMLAATGGLAQVTAVSNFLRPRARAMELTVEDIADHIDYAVRRMGIDHVGIGTDFDGGGGVRGFMNAAEAPNLTAALARRGYGRDELGKIWGGNFLRLMRLAEAAAASPKAAAD
ncbi:dipeptidase [Acidocella sp.]|uniref:dipeptidase n=1 Tax=Acidocella sp. TaxID=50710 RepID=UPI002611A683|nr:dipeptidase [Acidocella sp.]